MGKVVQELNRSYENGSSIFSEGDPGNCAYIVQKGQVELSMLNGTHSIVVATLGEGELLGEMALIDAQTRSTTATAIGTTELLIIPRSYVIQKMFTADPTLRLFLQVILDRYRDMRSRIMNVLDSVTNQENESDSAIHPSQPPEQLITTLMDEYNEMQSRVLEALNGNTDAFGIAGERHNIDGMYKEDADSTASEVSMGNSLQVALEEKQFELLFQPIMDLQSGRIAGCEALIRWHHPELGMLSPNKFIGILEETGLILSVGAWALENACNTAQRFNELSASIGIPALYMSINLSGKQFETANLAADIGIIIDRTGINPKQIKLEITESLLMLEPARAISSLQELQELGISVAIDDFGVGYSSFSYLQHFPIDTLKIDRSFVSTMLKNSKAMAIVHSLVLLAKNLKLKIIAEGVEHPTELAKLKEYGCDYVQGFMISEPITENQFMELIQSNTHIPHTDT